MVTEPVLKMSENHESIYLFFCPFNAPYFCNFFANIFPYFITIETIFPKIHSLELKSKSIKRKKIKSHNQCDYFKNYFPRKFTKDVSLKHCWASLKPNTYLIRVSKHLDWDGAIVDYLLPHNLTFIVAMNFPRPDFRNERYFIFP